ncbi:MAG: cell division protein FtsI, partial [Alistipes sp.]|nr:cell division protein FtsI [Alistipes sp.]
MAEQEPSQIKSDILTRVRALYLVFILVVAVVLVRLVYVQFLAPETRHNAKRLATRIFLPDTVYAQRGSILARDGEPLASSIFRYQPRFDFASEGFADEETFLTQSDSLAKLLSAYFGDRSVEQYRRLLRSKRDSARRYRLGKERDTTYYREDEGVLLLLLDLMTGRAKVTERVRDTLRDHRPTKILPRDVDYGEWEELRKYPILNYNMGVTYSLDEYDRRIYPQGDLARRLIGRTGTAGNYGLELLYDDELKGENGFSVRQRIARGFSTRVADAEHRDAVDGLHVVTTLDLNLQDVADRALRAQLEKQNATWGTTLVMESRTGEILAMANLGRAGDGRIIERENYALGYSMEPGSTFKLATVLTLLDDAQMSPDKVYETHDGNPVTVGQAKNIRDSHRGDHAIALKRAVAGSSNVYFAKAVWEYYGQTGKKQQFSDHLHKVLGLGETTGLDSLGERKPSVTTDWKVPDPGIMLVKMSYGYRVQMTPMQMLTFYNAIAN